MDIILSKLAEPVTLVTYIGGAWFKSQLEH